MAYLGVDWGQKTVGLAISHSGLMARQLTAVPTDQAIEKIENLVSDDKIETIVVGIPTTFQDQEGPQAQAVKKFAADLDKKVKAKITFEDEAFTTTEAENLGGSHSLAARLILEQWLNNNAKVK